MAITNGYCTLAEFTVYATARSQTAVTDSSDDTVIEDLIEASSRLIDSVVGRHFYTTSDEETRYFSPECGEIIFVDDLSEAPTTLKLDTGFDRSYATTMASTDYDLEPYNAAYKKLPYTWITIAPHAVNTFPNTTKGVQIVGHWGFPAVPDEIKVACEAITMNMYQERSGQSSGGNVTVTGAGVVIRPQDIPAWVMKTLEKYKRLI
jgi:hypothetical protein